MRRYRHYHDRTALGIPEILEGDNKDVKQDDVG